MSVIQISVQQLQKKLEDISKPILLDVRESYEFSYAHIIGSQHIPLQQIPQRINEIDSSLECIVICHHGIRSQQAAMFLSQSGFADIYNLSGGIDAWSTECDNSIPRY